MSCIIVVSRYNENIDWLKNEMNRCIIYNKGDPLQLQNEIIVENKGRESESYLRYIIDHYNQLPDGVVFTQANICDHVGKNDIQYLINMKNYALKYGKTKPYMHSQTKFNMHCWDKSWNYNNNSFYLQENYKNNKPVIFHNWFTTYINSTYPDPIYIYRNGIFAVRKDFILKKSIDYYKQLLLEVNHHINPAEGHFFERSWYYIFN
jgi:hypothetical protein